MGHFDLFNGFVDGGWLGRLKPTESAVWQAMLRFANANDECWPSVNKLAGLIGVQNREHVQRARSALVKLGLLSIVKTGGGKSAATYRLMIPAADLSAADKSTAADKSAPPAANLTAAPADKSTAAPAAKSAALTEQTTEQKTEHQKGEPPPSDFALPDELRASHEFVLLWNDWLATYRPRPATIKANLKNLAGLTVEQAIERVQYSLSNGKPAIHKKLWSEKNGQSAKQRGRIENLKAPILN